MRTVFGILLIQILLFSCARNKEGQYGTSNLTVGTTETQENENIGVAQVDQDQDESQASEEEETPEVPFTHRLFISSETYSGNLEGIRGANQKCQDLAAGAGLSGTYRAVIASNNEGRSGIGVFDNILISADVYMYSSEGEREKLITYTDTQDGFFIFNGLSVLRDENHQLREATEVWTGFDEEGEKTNDDCVAWTDGTIEEYGRSSFSEELESERIRECAELKRLICINQK